MNLRKFSVISSSRRNTPLVIKAIRVFFRFITNKHAIAALLIALLPVYPTIGNRFVLTNTASAQEDLESITLAEYNPEDYQEDADTVAVTGQQYIRANDPSVSSYSATNLTRLHVHKVTKQTSLQEVAANFRIPVSMLVWANNFGPEVETLEAGTLIKIPPVSGASYVIQAGDTTETIAKKYGVSPDKILSDYGQSIDEALPVGEVVIIAGATQPVIIAQARPEANEPDVPPPAPAPKPKPAPKPAPKPVVVKKPANTGSAELGERTYAIRSTPGGIKGFAWGNCTAFVAQYKNVTWRGNANQWIRNARAKGIPTGTKPAVGAIIQFE